MGISFSVYLDGFKKDITREINVNDNLNLQTFCEYMILSMNGECKHLYQLIVNDEFAYLGPGCCVFDPDFEEMMDEDLTVKDLYLEEGDELLLNYDFRCDYDIYIKVESTTDDIFNKDFEVINGKGYGLLEGYHSFYLEDLVSVRKRNSNAYSDIKYNILDFDIDKVNYNIDNYLTYKKELVKPKHYLLNVSLLGFEKEIKRKISIDSDISISTLCEAIILSMSGDLEHCYGLKRGKEYLKDEEMSKDINYLELKEGQRFKVIYDYGDNWVFNVRVSKVIEDYGSKRCYVLSGIGYGIVEDCGGEYYLDRIFNDDDNDYNIDEFDLDDVNSTIDNRLFSIFNEVSDE